MKPTRAKPPHWKLESSNYQFEGLEEGGEMINHRNQNQNKINTAYYDFSTKIA